MFGRLRHQRFIKLQAPIGCWACGQSELVDQKRRLGQSETRASKELEIEKIFDGFFVTRVATAGHFLEQ
jgi:hypothetical protein